MTKDEVKEFLFNPDQSRGTKTGIGFVCFAIFTIIRIKVNNEAIITYILEAVTILLFIYFLAKILMYNRKEEIMTRTKVTDFLLLIFTIILLIFNTISVFQE